MAEELNVLYQSDSNTQYYLGVSIVSLLFNNKDINKINIYIIDDGLEDTFLNQLNECIGSYPNAHIRIIEAKKMLANPIVRQFSTYKGKRNNKHSFLKLFWNVAITDKIERLVYIDCDTVVTGSLTDLMSFDIKDNYIAMAFDSLITSEIKHIGLSPNKPYFNSGVIVFNCGKWITDKCSLRIANHNKCYGTVDQDLLNVEFKGKIAVLPLKFNYQSIHMLLEPKQYCREFKRNNYYNRSEIEESGNDVRVVHFLKFLGKSVWDEGGKHPCEEVFRKYLDMSPWKGIPKNKKTVGIVFKLEKVLYSVLPRMIFVKLFHIAHKHMIVKSNKA